jgi:hypothetical protein
VRPGGTFHLYEHHPIWETLVVTYIVRAVKR